jgi:hypothetical protein
MECPMVPRLSCGFWPSVPRHMTCESWKIFDITPYENLILYMGSSSCRQVQYPSEACLTSHILVKLYRPSYPRKGTKREMNESLYSDVNTLEKQIGRRLRRMMFEECTIMLKVSPSIKDLEALEAPGSWVYDYDIETRSLLYSSAINQFSQPFPSNAR